MKVLGIQAGHCIIKPTCRSGRGQDGAWLEACRRLRIQYDEICKKRSDIDECDFNLVLTLVTPRHKEQKAETETSKGEPQGDPQTKT